MYYRNSAGSKEPVFLLITKHILQCLRQRMGDRTNHTSASSQTPCLRDDTSTSSRAGMWTTFQRQARLIREVYNTGFEFPDWSVRDLGDGTLEPHARSAVIYYARHADLARVKELVLQREPVNIAMSRRYNHEMLFNRFGYTRGAYSKCTAEFLMPHIAAYCKTPFVSRDGLSRVDMHVINAIGIAFDSAEQPDYCYFFRNGRIPEDRWEKLIARMSLTWRFIFTCARAKGLRSIYLTQVGGGYFAHLLNQDPSKNYQRLRSLTLEPVKAEFPEIVVEDLRAIFDNVFAHEDVLQNSLLVNAWDPWSMVGNGNGRDDSLDGMYGRFSAMAVLCWPKTNPYLQYEAVDVP